MDQPLTYRSTGTLKQFTILNAGGATVTAVANAATITSAPDRRAGSRQNIVRCRPAGAVDALAGHDGAQRRTGTINLALGELAFALCSCRSTIRPKAARSNSQPGARPRTGINVAVLRM